MIGVYVESNFVLELARQQDEAPSAEELLRLAEDSKVRLRTPAFSLCEPFSTLTYYGNDRRRFAELLDRQVKDLGRSHMHRHLTPLLQPAIQSMLQIERMEMGLLEQTVQRLVRAGSMLELRLETFQAAHLYEGELDLSPQDAIVLASVLHDLTQTGGQGPSCFVSRNSRDFDDPEIDAKLAPLDCRHIAKISDAAAFVRNNLGA
jgi:hypothetical protein